jgi:gliding motility-associated-like protein
MFIIDHNRYFTTNAGGINDPWKISKINTIIMAKISIFDRCGKLVKEMNTTEAGRAGLRMANSYQLGINLFTNNYLKAGISKEFTSHFSLKRLPQ